METEFKKQEYRTYLSDELASRAQKNPAYSLRSFSRALGISPASLSQILAGKRPLSKKTALKIADRLNLSPEEAEEFLLSAIGFQRAAINDLPLKEYHELQLDTFRAIADWQHYAILGLASLDRNASKASWIAKMLRISKREAKTSYDRLLRLGLIERNGIGFRQAGSCLKVQTQAHETAIRKYHSQNLRKALELLERRETRIELYSSITMAVDESKIEEARALTQTFRRKLSELVESGKKERVYTLAIQLFPVSERVIV